MNLGGSVRRLRRALVGDRRRDSVAQIWRRQPLELARAVSVVRMFYVCAGYLMVRSAENWSEWATVKTLHLLWPLSWIEWTGVAAGVPTVLGGALATTLWAAFAPGVRAARLAAAIGLLMHAALLNSLSGRVMAHGLHAWFWVACLFVMLPGGSSSQIAASRARAQAYLRLFWAAQATLLLFYSLSGAFKLAGAVVQFARGQAHALVPEALARHVAHRILQGAELPGYFALGPWLVDHPSWGILIYPAAIFLEATAIVVAFRPALHRIWGTALIALHLGIFFTMTIMFSAQVLIVGLLLLASPFAPDRIDAQQVLRQFPLLGDLRRFLLGRRSAAMPSARVPMSN